MAMKSSFVCAPEDEKMAKIKWAQWYGTPCSYVPYLPLLFCCAGAGDAWRHPPRAARHHPRPQEQETGAGASHTSSTLDTDTNNLREVWSFHNHWKDALRSLVNYCTTPNFAKVRFELYVVAKGRSKYVCWCSFTNCCQHLLTVNGYVLEFFSKCRTRKMR